jgi:hypothetical protein
MNDQTKGLYQKYHVERLNDPEGKHEDCPFFVLDIIHDRYARYAMQCYIAACRIQFPQLASDLKKLLDENPPAE